jgi:glutamate racemase
MRIHLSGDTARLPYGTKSPATVARYAATAAAALAARGLKCLVVACNTASASSLPAMREQACRCAHRRRDRARCRGGLRGFRLRPHRRDRNRRHGQRRRLSGGHPAPPQRCAHSRHRDAALRRARRRRARVGAHRTRRGAPLSGALAAASPDAPDTLVLGCTHFPMLLEVIRAAVGERMRIVDSAATTARKCGSAWRARDLRAGAGASTVRFLASDGAERFARVGSRFLARPSRGRRRTHRPVGVLLRQLVRQRQGGGLDGRRGIRGPGASSRALGPRRPETRTPSSPLTASTTLNARPSLKRPAAPGASFLRSRACEALHAAFDAPAIVRARDDLLARVATLVEGDGAERIEVQHLRDELLGGCGVHLRQAGGDVQRRHSCRSPDGAHPHLRLGSRASGRFGADAHSALPPRVPALARRSLARSHRNAHIRRDVFDCNLGPQDEFRKPRRDARGKLARQDGENLIRRGAHELQDCDRAPLGVVIAREHRVLARADAPRRLRADPAESARHRCPGCAGPEVGQELWLRLHRACASALFLQRFPVVPAGNSGRLGVYAKCPGQSRSRPILCRSAGDAPAVVPYLKPEETGGPAGPEPTRFGDWERKGRCIDF